MIIRLRNTQSLTFIFIHVRCGLTSLFCVYPISTPVLVDQTKWIADSQFQYRNGFQKSKTLNLHFTKYPYIEMQGLQSLVIVVDTVFNIITRNYISFRRKRETPSAIYTQT